MRNLTIDSEIKSIIPPLTSNEYEQLEKNLQADGCRDTLVVWNGILLDGHNRLEICQKLDIRFEVLEMEFKDKAAAKIWVIDNQKGRRNLSDGWKFELIQEKAKLLTERGRVKMSDGGKGLSPSDKPSLLHDTRQQLAAELGWSTGKTAEAQYIWKHGDTAIKENVKASEETIKNAYKKVKKKKRSEEIAEEREKIAEAGAVATPSGKWNVYHGDMRTIELNKRYDFIITDPPYPREYLPLYVALAKRVTEWLKPGGLLVCMCGQSYLNQIYAIFDQYLAYYWTACFLTPHQPTPLRQRQVNTSWKPLLIYGKQQNYNGKTFGDVFTSEQAAKNHHRWEQSESGMVAIVKQVCLPGQIVLDPFCGAGTTGVAALQHGCLFDGIDVDETSVNITRRRLNDQAPL